MLTMKQGGVPSASRVRHGERMDEAFEHQGHRTAVSQRALQAHADPWLGWARMDGGPHDGVGFVVAELSPYQADLDWSSLTEPDEMGEVLEQLGRATAKVHCVSDVDDASTPLVDFQVEDAVAAAVEGAEDQFVDGVVAFAHSYATQVRADHTLFVQQESPKIFCAISPTWTPLPSRTTTLDLTIFAGRVRPMTMRPSASTTCRRCVLCPSGRTASAFFIRLWPTSLTAPICRPCWS